MVSSHDSYTSFTSTLSAVVFGTVGVLKINGLHSFLKPRTCYVKHCLSSNLGLDIHGLKEFGNSHQLST